MRKTSKPVLLLKPNELKECFFNTLVKLFWRVYLYVMPRMVEAGKFSIDKADWSKLIQHCKKLGDLFHFNNVIGPIHFSNKPFIETTINDTSEYEVSNFANSKH